MARSVLGSEVYAFADGFDAAFSIKYDLEKMTGLHIPILMLTDSKSLFDIITKSSTTREKRLLIDIATVRNAYNNNELSKVGNILSNQNPSDAFTKVGKCKALISILEAGTITLEVNQWVNRPIFESNSTSRIRDA